MVGNKISLLTSILLCFCGCVNDATKIVQSEFTCVTDSKPCSDSLYAEWSKGGIFINTREIELCYTIHNDTKEIIYLPIRSWSDSTVESSIKVYFINEMDTICPHFYVKKIPYNSNHICKGDSTMLFITICQFYKWSKKGIDVNTSLDTLINRLHVVYNKSLKDVKKNSEIPNIKFDKLPMSYYEIPQDKSILKKIHRDRVLIKSRENHEVSNLGDHGVGSSDHKEAKQEVK